MVATSAIIAQALNGLSQMMLLVLIASGLTIIFGLMDILNFAHGSFYMLGAYIGLSTYLLTEQFFLAIVVAFILVGALGGLLEYTTLRPLYGRDPVDHLLITFGFLLVLDQSAHFIWGADLKSMPTPDLLDFSLQLGMLSYPAYRIFIFLFGLAFVGGMFLLIQRSNMGLIIRAGTHNTETVRSLGINLPRAFTMTFAFGAGIAGVSGVIAAPVVGLSPTMGVSIIIDAFIVVVIGGLGSFRGSIVAAFIIAEVRALGALFFPGFTSILVLLALVVTLVIKPEGLFPTSITEA
ncbi:branched-chain amino acid ABC transporter permease [Haloarchaeobius salinus]|uniref:branched-chain amino acid ABC transporter permease n=1 Tax=Haloarchaeobius salinus TaxID=1198298 RepID=UPI002109053C|nr:branched-chain amino acid ABC transporter permease [Haloarchaeobius salinus]